MESIQSFGANKLILNLWAIIWLTTICLLEMKAKINDVSDNYSSVQNAIFHHAFAETMASIFSIVFICFSSQAKQPFSGDRKKKKCQT